MIDRVPLFAPVADTSAIVFVVHLLHLLPLPKERARSGLQGLAYGMESGRMRLVCMSVIWLVGRCLGVATTVVKRKIIKVLVHLAYGAHSRRSVPSSVDLRGIH